MGYVSKHVEGKVYYFDCDMCGQFHPDKNWDGNCEHERYTGEELDTKHDGPDGWALECFTELVWIDDAPPAPQQLQAAA